MNKEIHKELEEVSPLLANLPKEELKAPEGYFDTFSTRLIDRIHLEENKPSKSLIISFKHFSKYVAAAAVLIFMGLSIYIIKINNDTKINKVAEQNFNTEDLYLSEIDEATLVEYANTSIPLENKTDVETYQDYIDEETIIEEINL